MLPEKLTQSQKNLKITQKVMEIRYFSQKSRKSKEIWKDFKALWYVIANFKTESLKIFKTNLNI